MNDFSPWTQGNWYELGSLLTQLGFLAAGVWFARNLVKILRAFEEQIGALLKLSITAPPAERQTTSPETSPYWLTPSIEQTAGVPEPTKSGPGRLTVAWRALIHWLREPMSPADLLPWHRSHQATR
jgi:hypothetical protein